jgi:hypothetical protein
MDEGPYFGKRLLRCYNVAGFSNKKEIRLKGWSGDLCREYSRLFGTPRRLKEIGTRAYKNKIILGTVRTVDRDRKQRPLPKGLEYSVIDELLEVVAG